MRRSLQPTHAAQVVHLLQDGTSIWPVGRRFTVSSSTVSRAWRRFQETSRYEESMSGHQPSNRSGIFSFVWGGTVGALPEPYKITPSRLLVCMFQRQTSTSGICAPSPAPCISIGISKTTQELTGPRNDRSRENNQWSINSKYYSKRKMIINNIPVNDGLDGVVG